jgi:hypothetical protein
VFCGDIKHGTIEVVHLQLQRFRGDGRGLVVRYPTHIPPTHAGPERGGGGSIKALDVCALGVVSSLSSSPSSAAPIEGGSKPACLLLLCLGLLLLLGECVCVWSLLLFAADGALVGDDGGQWRGGWGLN